MFFSEVEGHMQKLSSFEQGKKIGLKSHFSGYSTQPFNYVAPPQETKMFQRRERLGKRGEPGIFCPFLPQATQANEFCSKKDA